MSAAPEVAPALGDWVADWVGLGHCADEDPDALFVQGKAQRAAKVMCKGCPVMAECLADALDNRTEFGVWGGMTPPYGKVACASGGCQRCAHGAQPVEVVDVGRARRNGRDRHPGVAGDEPAHVPLVTLGDRGQVGVQAQQRGSELAAPGILELLGSRGRPTPAQ